MRYWLMKSEPSVVGIDDVLAMPDRTVDWWGVRNYQARNFMRDQMKVGDKVFFYHSSCPEPGIAGLAEVAKLAYPDRTQFDPASPVPTIGGNISSGGGILLAGGYDQRGGEHVWNFQQPIPLSARNDVLVFQTEPLEEDVEVTGELLVKLWISSSAVDTDFTAKLVDVYPPSGDFPRGFDLNIADGILRARFREDLKREVLMQPGTIYPIAIKLYPTSNVFKRGHRIRVDVSSSNFPRFDVNPNTGEPLNEQRRSGQPARDGSHCFSPIHRLILPEAGTAGGSVPEVAEITVARRGAGEGVARGLVLLVEVVPDPGLGGFPENRREIDGPAAEVGKVPPRGGIHVLDVDQGEPARPAREVVERIPPALDGPVEVQLEPDQPGIGLPKQDIERNPALQRHEFEVVIVVAERQPMAEGGFARPVEPFRHPLPGIQAGPVGCAQEGYHDVLLPDRRGLLEGPFPGLVHRPKAHVT